MVKGSSEGGWIGGRFRLEEEDSLRRQKGFLSGGGEGWRWRSELWVFVEYWRKGTNRKVNSVPVYYAQLIAFPLFVRYIDFGFAGTPTSQSCRRSGGTGPGFIEGGSGGDEAERIISSDIAGVGIEARSWRRGGFAERVADRDGHFRILFRMKSSRLEYRM